MQRRPNGQLFRARDTNVLGLNVRGSGAIPDVALVAGRTPSGGELHDAEDLTKMHALALGDAWHGHWILYG